MLLPPHDPELLLLLSANGLLMEPPRGGLLTVEDGEVGLELANGEAEGGEVGVWA